MGGSVNFPVGRDGFSVTVSVADQLDALILPVVVPVQVAVPGWVGLPDFPASVVGVEDRFSCRLFGARAVMDDCTAALAAPAKHQNRCAALVAVLVEQIQATAVVEGGVLSLDAWQQNTSFMCLRSETAAVLHVPEGAAGRLMRHSAVLVRELPATLGAMQEGWLGWEHAVIISEEVSLLREAGVDQHVRDAFEELLLDKAGDSTTPSFREKARRARERAYPQTLVPRTRRALADRQVRVSRGQDGMSWLTLFASSPAIEAIFTQCISTAHAVQGPHTTRTLTQLRADIATALLLGQSMDENHLHTPSVPTSTPVTAATTTTAATAGTAASTTGAGAFSFGGGLYPEPAGEGCGVSTGWVPVFDDPDYADPNFVEPDADPSLEGAFVPEPLNRPPARPPTLTPAPGPPSSGAVGGVGGGVWPPLPRVTPVVLLPMLSLLGFSSDPAWMEGVGPISIEVAKHLTANASSFYRVLVDPVTNKPLDRAPDTYRMSKAMRVMLRIRDEYCQFPGCNKVAVNCEVDHVVKFETGGRSVYDNLECLCQRHHRIKHYKDDKTRHGCARTDKSAKRQQTRLRGWTPAMTASGHPGWTSPAGRYYPPPP